MKKRIEVLIIAIAIAVGTLFAGSPATVSAKAAKPSLNKKSVCIAIGDTVKIKVKKAKSKVKWKTSNSKVCTVKGSGKKKSSGTITGKGVGKATVTATVSKKRLSCSVEVVKFLIKNKISDCKVGDMVYYGEYEQDNDKTNGKEPISWYVIKEERNAVLLLSEYNLDCIKYDSGHGNITWNDSEIREWLNGTFYENSFTQTERSKIADCYCYNWDNPYYEVTAGRNTIDKVFLLGYADLYEFFCYKNVGSEVWDYSKDERMRAKNTPYSYARGIVSYNNATETVSKPEYAKPYDPEGCGKYWLRSCGKTTDYAMFVDYEGNVWVEGTLIYTDKIGVRPAMWVKK